MTTEFPNVRVLLVESDEVNIFVMEKTLGKKFHLTIARNGVEALNFAHKKTRDLVLTEIRLNHSMDGVEVMEEFRKNSMNDSAEIWAITSVGLPEDDSYFKDLGFDRYIPKPLNNGELIEAIKEALPQRVCA